MPEENVDLLLGIEESPKVAVTDANSSASEFKQNNAASTTWDHYNSGQGVASESKQNNAAENTLTIIANIVLWCGIICMIFCLFTLTTTEVSSYSHRREFNPAGLTATIGVFVSSLISWAVLKVLANISLTLKDINSKIK